MMQRSSNGMVRNVLIGSISVILLLIVLYYMKRVEVGRIKKDMDHLVAQRADREDELNRKLTEYLQKLEDMTRRLGDVNSRLQECDDGKASITMEVQKCKSTYSTCIAEKEQAETNLRAKETELNRVKVEHETLNQRASSHTQEMAGLQTSLRNAEHELDQCEDEKERCQTSLREANTHVQECVQRETNCQASLRSGARQAFMQSQPQQQLQQQPGFQQGFQQPVNGVNQVMGGQPVGGVPQQLQQQPFPNQLPPATPAPRPTPKAAVEPPAEKRGEEFGDGEELDGLQFLEEGARPASKRPEGEGQGEGEGGHNEAEQRHEEPGDGGNAGGDDVEGANRQAENAQAQDELDSLLNREKDSIL